MSHYICKKIRNYFNKHTTMLEIAILRNEKERVLTGLTKKNVSQGILDSINEIINLDDQRKSVQSKLDEKLAESNNLAKIIGDLYKSGQTEEANHNKIKVAELKEITKELETELHSIKNMLEDKLYAVPNLPHSSVPSGKTPEDNEVFKAWDKPMPQLPENALPHWELADKYQVFDLKLGVKITGAGFPLYRGKGAKLQRALIQFFLEEAIKAGYEEIIPPLLVNESTALATGQLPDKEGQMYYCEKDDLYLIPTAEVPVTNIYRDVLMEEKDFPIKMTGYTPCFRREAGSYGAHVKGLNRVHQFDKVEIVQIAHPAHSYRILDEMLAHVSSLLDKLELPYRILRLCGGDMSFASALTFDFEVWSAAQERWLEVSSVSNFETFQSNRMKLRYKDETGKSRLAHTLNGSALALARIMASILENHQTPEGIRIPEALRPYTGFDFLT
jgi:seryl-tRNA synthetase